MRKYLGMNPEDPVSQGLLKVHFVIKAWQDTQKMLQKVGGCSEQSLGGPPAGGPEGVSGGEMRRKSRE